MAIVVIHPLLVAKGKFKYNKKEFLTAIQDTIDMYDKARENHKDGKWLEKVIDNYKIITGNEI